MRTPPDEVAGVVNVANAYFATRNYRRVEDALRAAMAADPNNPLLLVAYARAKLGQSDYAAAAMSAHAALSATLLPSAELLRPRCAIALSNLRTTASFIGASLGRRSKVVVRPLATR